MSEKTLSENSPVSIQVGGTTYNNLVAWKPNYQAVGGGDAVTGRTVGNNHSPIGVTHHPKECIVDVIFDSDVIPALITGGFWNPTGENTSTTLVVTEKATDGKTRTVSYSNVRVQQMPSSYTVRGEQHTEVIFHSYGAVTYSGWT